VTQKDFGPELRRFDCGIDFMHGAAFYGFRA
jgi:hypothetical protein